MRRYSKKMLLVKGRQRVGDWTTPRNVTIDFFRRSAVFVYNSSYSTAKKEIGDNGTVRRIEAE